MAVAPSTVHVGELLREWRRQRRLSQLDLAMASAVSPRHLSFIETGRAQPSREMILHLAQRLDVPLRERNRLLLAAGYAPVFGERSLDDREMAPVREALARFLASHEPYPALVMDSHWNIVAANRVIDFLTQGVADELLAPPANVLRIALHPQGMAPRIVNFADWSGYLLERLRREIVATRDQELAALREELTSYPGVTPNPDDAQSANRILLLHELRLDNAALALFSTTTTFGTARHVTLAELTIEAFYPADAQTATALAEAASAD
jgi:transcriptional regulator with XRE-family HTH domain